MWNTGVCVVERFQIHAKIVLDGFRAPGSLILCLAVTDFLNYLRGGLGLSFRVERFGKRYMSGSTQ